MSGFSVALPYVADRSRFAATVATLANLRPRNGDVIQLAGYHSAGDGGGQALRYVSDSTATVDGGSVFNGPGSVGRYLSVSQESLNARHFGARSDYVYPNTGTDNSAALQAYFNFVQSISGHRSRRRAIVPPGEYRFNTPLIVPSDVDLDARGVTLEYRGSNRDAPLLQIGTEDDQAFSPFHRLPDVNGTAVNIQSLTETQIANYAAVRFCNMTNGTVYLGNAQSTAIGYLFLPTNNSGIVQSKFISGRCSGVKYGVVLRGGAGVSHVNENVFTNVDFSFASNSNPLGTLAGVKFDAIAGGYTGQNNNRFNDCCFQIPNHSAAQEIAVSKVVAANTIHVNLTTQREYLCVTGGTVATIPTQTDGTTSAPDANGVEWKDLGHYFRSPVFFDGAGGLNKIIGARWEGGYGPFAMVRGNHGRSEIEVYQRHYLDARSNPPIDECTLQTQNFPLRNCNSVYREYASPGQQVVMLPELHKRAVGSAAGFTVAGFHFFNVFTPNTVSPFTASGITLLRNGLRVYTYPTIMGFFVELDPEIFRACLTANREGSNAVSCYFTVRNQQNALVALSTTDKQYATSASSFVSAWNFYQQAEEFLRVSKGPTSTHHRWEFSISNAVSLRWASLTVDVIPRAGGAYTPKIYSRFGPTVDPPGRSSQGTPTVGFFERAGEIIGNLNTASAEPIGWIVRTPGILAPAWVTSTAVLANELRENGGNVYAAVSAGTTGGTAPTGTSTSIDDGAVLWDYVAPVASLVALTQTYS